MIDLRVHGRGHAEGRRRDSASSRLGRLEDSVTL